jgi:hypothetical protein
MKNSQTVTYIVLVLLAVLVGGMFFGGNFSTSEKQDPATIATACSLDTTLTLSVVDKYNEGTAVSAPTLKYSQNGGNFLDFTSGTTKLKPGLPVKVFISKSDYIDRVVEIPALSCGVNTAKQTLAATDSIAMKIYDMQFNQLTDSATGGAVNLSAVNTGSTARVKLELVANSNQDSGDLVIVVETSSTANVSEIVLSGASKTTTPSFYTQSATGTAVQAFEISSLNNNAEFMNTLSIVPKASKDINGAVYVTVYSKQAFPDTDGSIKVGIENSQGTNKYEDTYDYDFFIEN